MQLTFLSAAVPLTKTFSLNNGVLEKQAHPKITSCTTHEEEVNTIEEFKNALEAHAAQGHCLLKGNTNRPLVKESRASSTDANAPTSWLCLDIDRLKNCKHVDTLLTALKVSHVDHIVQFSSSMGVMPDSGMSAHVFMFITDKGIPESLKRWLTYENLTQDLLINNLNLTRTGNALRWGLDVTTCQNDKLIYIAPPILGKGVKDSLKGARIQLIKRSARSLKLRDDIPNSEGIRDLVKKGLNLIRARDGLPEKVLTTRTVGNIEYTTNPDVAQVTSVKEDGPWVHLNLNGGDSWAYWHLKSNPEFIHNFKGEPSYKTSELLPDYWKTVQPNVSVPEPSPDGVEYIVFRNLNTASYHNAIWEPTKRELTIAPARSVGQLKDFMKFHGQPEFPFVEDWRIIFDPHSGKTVDREKRIINEYHATDYMLLPPSKGARVPPIIHKIIWNAFGSDQETLERFLNWAAVIYQLRIKCGTAWLTYGTTGTGKGTLANKVLGPIYGHVEFRKSRDILSIYNEFLEKSLILIVDEAELGGKNGGSIIDSDLRNFISEPTVSIRKMYQAPYSAISYVNSMFLANGHVPLTLKKNDRRFNIAPFQPNPLVFKDGEYEAIGDERAEFSQFLGAYAIDVDVARTPLLNEARKTLIWMGMAGTDSAIDHLKNGDYQFFVEGMPAIHSGGASGPEQTLTAEYMILVNEMHKRDYLLREEVQTLLRYLMDNIPISPYKFVSYMKHHDIVFETVTHNGKTYKGLKVSWKLTGSSSTNGATSS